MSEKKKPNKFSLHSIEKPNDTQGSFGAILRIPLTKSFSSSIRIKTNSKDEDIQVPMCTNWSHPEWSYTCSGLFQQFYHLVFLLVFCSCLFRVYFLVLFSLLLVFGFFFWLFEIVFFCEFKQGHHH